MKLQSSVPAKIENIFANEPRVSLDSLHTEHVVRSAKHKVSLKHIILVDPSSQSTMMMIMIILKVSIMSRIILKCIFVQSFSIT